MHKLDSLSKPHTLAYCFAFTLFTLILWVSESPLNKKPVENLSQKTALQNRAEAKPSYKGLFIMHLNSDVLC